MEWFDGQGLLEFIDDRLNLNFGPVVGCFQGGVFVGVNVGDYGKAASAVIEDEYHVGDEEDHVGQAEVVWRGFWKGGLEVTHHVVSEVADCAATENRKRWRTMRAVGAHKFFEGFERISSDCEAAFATALCNFDFSTPGSDDGARGGAKE